MQQAPLLQENLYRLNMTTTFGQRLRRAREKAELSQSDLARRIGLNRPANIQYLEDPKNGAEGSQYTASLARACGVDPIWLERGDGQMTSGEAHPTVSESELSRAIGRLDPEMRAAFFKILQALSPPGPRTFPTGAAGELASGQRAKSSRSRAA